MFFHKKRSALLRSVAALSLMTLGGWAVLPSQALALDYADASGDVSAHVGGWLRNWTGFNMDKVPSSEMKTKWWDPAMVRNEILLDMDAKTGPVAWKFIGRFDKEIETDYLHTLDHLNNIQSPNGTVGNGRYMEQVDTNTFLQGAREFYAAFDVGNRLNLRIGKQQIVWGESDFFHAMDIISGFDYRQRLFFENNEEYRKPLMMAKVNLSVPEANGNLDMFVRPGLDPKDSIGSSYNIEGGRWQTTPYNGVDFTAFTQYNLQNPKGNKDDPTYGARWKGDWNEIGYSVAYIRTFNPDPIINPNRNSATQAAFGVNDSNSYGGAPINKMLGDWIYPEINSFGATGNYYVAPVDSVFNVEAVYIPKKPYNYGMLQSSLPGWGGVKEKDTMVSMLRIDKNLNMTPSLLGTNRPSLSSFQVFDTWNMAYNANDQIVQFASFGHVQHEHTTYVTWFAVLNYLGDTINPSFVVGVDASNGGGFLIPAIDFALGDVWRLKFEADLFWDNNSKKQSAVNNLGGHTNPLGISENQAGLFGYFHGDDQFVMRVTRQF
jgi:hypothetical protein